jgi:hypothetical protein
MTDRHPTTRQDRFDKADAAFNDACAEVNRTYEAWTDACERLKRIGRERLDAWGDLVANGAEPPLQPAPGATLRAFQEWSLDAIDRHADGAVGEPAEPERKWPLSDHPDQVG